MTIRAAAVISTFRGGVVVCNEEQLSLPQIQHLEKIPVSAIAYVCELPQHIGLTEQGCIGNEATVTVLLFFWHLSLFTNGWISVLGLGHCFLMHLMQLGCIFVFQFYSTFFNQKKTPTEIFLKIHFFRCPGQDWQEHSSQHYKHPKQCGNQLILMFSWCASATRGNCTEWDNSQSAFTEGL